MNRKHAFLNGLIPFVAFPFFLGGCSDPIGPAINQGELTGEITYEEGESGLPMFPKKVVLKVGQSIKFWPEWEEADDSLIPYEDLFWESGNSGVATVDQDGTVLALREGAATITATGKEGRAQAEVTVIDS